MLVIHNHDAAVKCFQSLSVISKGDWDARLEIHADAVSFPQGTPWHQVSHKRKVTMLGAWAGRQKVPHLNNDSLSFLKAAQIQVNFWKVNVKLKSSCEWCRTSN